MRRLLCHLGIHSPAWTPLQPDGDRWLYIRTCTRCSRPLGRRRR